MHRIQGASSDPDVAAPDALAGVLGSPQKNVSNSLTRSHIVWALIELAFFEHIFAAHEKPRKKPRKAGELTAGAERFRNSPRDGPIGSVHCYATIKLQNLAGVRGVGLQQLICFCVFTSLAQLSGGCGRDGLQKVGACFDLQFHFARGTSRNPV